MPVQNIPAIPNIHYVRTGPRGATPVLFLHALGLDLSIWEKQFSEFGSSRDLIAVDLPGHGLSGHPDAAPDFHDMAHIVAQLIAHLKLEQVHLVGISVGGMIAQCIAVSFPGLVKSLMLLATSCQFAPAIRTVLKERADFVRENGMDAIIPLHLKRWFPDDFRDRHPEVSEGFASILQHQEKEYHAGMWDMVATLNLGPQLGSVTCPVLVIAGEEDPSAPPAAGQTICDLVGDGRLVVLPGCGHFPQMEKPLEVNALMRSFHA